MSKTQSALSSQLKTLVTIKSHRLHLLREAAARPGVIAPPETEVELHALEADIEALEAELGGLKATRLEPLLIGEDVLRGCTAEQLRLLDDRFTHQADKIRALEVSLASGGLLGRLANSAAAGWLAAVVVLLLAVAGSSLYASNLRNATSATATAALVALNTALAATVQPGAAPGQPAAVTDTPPPSPETATPTLTFTPSPLAPTISPTAPLPVTPTLTLTPSPVPDTPTATPTLTPTATLPPPALTLLEARPVDEPAATTEFVWQWSRPLAENEGFEVRVWRAGENPLGVHDAVLDNRQGRVTALGDNTYSLTVDLRTAPGVQAAGEYLWTVLLIQTSPEYRELGSQAPPAPFEFGGN